ncbi:MAG: peptidoglycan editing factor PgeF [Ignavibacteria bacterium]|nr:peptidoglycan editing factor PgeF [Ignavibacteria bacterium]
MIKTEIIYSRLFKKYPELIFGFSTRKGGVSPEPYCLNLGNLTGDDPLNVTENRKIFFNELGIKAEEVTFQKQIHSSTVNYSSGPQLFEGCDAVYTDKKNNFLAVSTADCIPVFLFDPKKKFIAGIHSGWKGTYNKILTKTITELEEKHSVNPSDIIAYIGPGISQDNYETGKEVGILFDEDIRYEKDGKYFPDLKKDNYRQLLQKGVREENIEVSEYCTFTEKELFHSYRRDGMKSGRMLGIIGMRF